MLKMFVLDVLNWFQNDYHKEYYFFLLSTENATNKLLKYKILLLNKQGFLKIKLQLVQWITKVRNKHLFKICILLRCISIIDTFKYANSYSQWSNTHQSKWCISAQIFVNLYIVEIPLSNS